MFASDENEPSFNTFPSMTQKEGVSTDLFLGRANQTLLFLFQN